MIETNKIDNNDSKIVFNLSKIKPMLELPIKFNCGL